MCLISVDDRTTFSGSTSPSRLLINFFVISVPKISIFHFICIFISSSISLVFPKSLRDYGAVERAFIRIIILIAKNEFFSFISSSFFNQYLHKFLGYVRSFSRKELCMIVILPTFNFRLQNIIFYIKNFVCLFVCV
jgi:hypothetical protein